MRERSPATPDEEDAVVPTQRDLEKLIRSCLGTTGIHGVALEALVFRIMDACRDYGDQRYQEGVWDGQEIG
jgi:hypothetical protein